MRRKGDKVGSEEKIQQIHENASELGGKEEWGYKFGNQRLSCKKKRDGPLSVPSQKAKN